MEPGRGRLICIGRLSAKTEDNTKNISGKYRMGIGGPRDGGSTSSFDFNLEAVLNLIFGKNGDNTEVGSLEQLNLNCSLGGTTLLSPGLSGIMGPNYSTGSEVLSGLQSDAGLTTKLGPTSTVWVEESPASLSDARRSKQDSAAFELEMTLTSAFFF
ncbi:hypothetical protein TorRG33x02_054990 [Trema orientale]|uniref:Uncharacterized protein n=1 Tax=Trema orientale TaxID=63057 RepID=A0A2P5FLE4_TREOI|nr:hypothetical protein TorRG33x02_054990 [Trema orientale]